MQQRILESGADAVRRINRWSLRLFGLVAKVRPDERRDAAGAFLTLFGFMTGHALLETARDALFLASIPARRLPWAYLAIALFALIIGQREPRVVRGISARNELGRWLLFAGAVTCGFWLLVDPDRAWLLYGLYVWSGVLASLVVVRFWTVLGSRFTVTQAKRVFPVIGSGSVAGAIAGSAAARLLTAVLAPRYLVLAAGAAFLATAAAPSMLGSDDPTPRRAPDPADLFRQILSGPYLRRVTELVVLATVTFTLVDFVFKSAAARFVPPDDLGAFFSSVYLSFNLASLLVQVGVVGWLLRRFGVTTAIAVAPAALLMSTLGFAVWGTLALALVLKGTDGTLRHSLYRTGTELLFVPLSGTMRHVKGFIDVLGQRGGQAIASIVILMVLSTTGREGVFAGLACLTAAGWLAVAVGLREHYLNLFRETLHEEGGRRRTDHPALDLASLETLLATLNAPDERRVLAALDVLDAQGKASVVPALVLYHPSADVVVRTLELFASAQRHDALPMVTRLASHTDPAVRAASLRAHTALEPQREVLVAALQDRDRSVRATADTLLIACGWEEPESLERLLEVADGGTSAERRALALAVRARPHPAHEQSLLAMLRDDDPAVLVDAIDAARALGTPGLVDPLLPLLARRTVREAVREALASFGPLALARLEAALDDTELPHRVRRHVPGAIALVGSPRVPDALLRHLQREPNGMIRFKVLRALGRWRDRQPHVPMDLALLQQALAQAVSVGFRMMGWRRVLVERAEKEPAVRTELHEVLVALLSDKQDHALERIFRLLNLQTGSEEFQRVYRGLHSRQPALRAGSRELLQHIVLAPMRKPLLTLVEDLHGGEAAAVRWFEDDVTAAMYATVLSEIVECGMESASSIAAAHAAELGVSGVLPALSRCEPLSSEHARVLERCAEAIRSGAAA